ncbi:N-acetyltransferase family protein [Bacillus gobiensis]|uniref:GNAT family N-acetyltransferase n=1 Tax=Bacillus gobiensis TaxID=1441095 RepID=UPI003D1FF084
MKIRWIDDIRREKILFDPNNQEWVKHIEISNEFNAYWFILIQNSSMPGYYFTSVNEISEENECYVHLFVTDKTYKYLSNLNYVFKNLEERLKGEEIKIIYVEFISSLENLFENIHNNFTCGFPEWKSVVTLLEKPLCTDEKIPRNNNSEFNIREYVPSDEENILDCLTKAYITGLSASGEKLSELNAKKIETKVRELYIPLKNENRIILVCEKGKEFCGHISYEINEESTEKVAELLDVFVLEKFQSKGLARLLSQYGEDVCRRRKIQKIRGNIVSNSENEENLLKNLKQSGWIVISKVYAKLIGGNALCQSH